MAAQDPTRNQCNYVTPKMGVILADMYTVFQHEHEVSMNLKT